MKHKIYTKTTRLLALILALALVVGLTGCFQKDDPQPTEEPTIPTETTPVQETPTEEQPTEPPTEAPTEAPAEVVMGTVTANNLNVRPSPSTDNSALYMLPVDLRVEILEQKTVDDITWGRIGEMTLPNGTKIVGGWINLRYVKLDGAEEPDPTEPAKENESISGEGKMGTITASELNIRKGAGSTYEAIDAYIFGDRVEILEQKTVDGTTWGRTNKGWISMKYVKLDGASETPVENDKDDDKNSNTEVVSDGKTKVLGYGVVDIGSLNVRSGPGTKYDVVSSVSNCTRHAYYQKSGNWVRLKDGWVSTSYFYVEGTTGDGAGTGKVTVDGLYVRTGPGTGFKTVTSHKKGDSVKILAQVNGWGYTGKGWVSMKYVELEETTVNYKTGKGTITADSLNIRKEAKDDAKVVGTYKKGDKVEITEIKGKWGKTDKGWISMKYVKMDETKKDDDDDQKYDDDEIGKNTVFKKGNATVKVNSVLTIRKTADKNGEKVGSYEDGAKVKILEVKGEWGKTDKGWINLRYVVYK